MSTFESPRPMTTTVHPFVTFRRDLKPKQHVYIDFPADDGMPWTAYKGYATTICREPLEEWEGQEYWFVETSEWVCSCFPVTSIYPIS